MDIDRALEILDANRDRADAIVSVSKSVASHPVFDVIIKDGLIRPYLNENFFAISRMRQQEISDVYFLDGSLYISATDAFVDKQSFYHERTLPYIVPKWKSFEIDDMVDFICVEAIMNNIEKIDRRDLNK